MLSPIDWAIIGLYMVFSIGLGLYYMKRGSQNLEEYFVAGRKLTWWIAGTSMVATSFAADTPLAIARIVRQYGIQQNWYWWSGVMGFVVCMFLFAPLWQRAKILTDAELVELRYSGKPAAFLRGFQACYRSLISNCITMGWVILGMQKVTEVAFGGDKLLSIVLLIIAAVLYTVLSGMWGVVMTDLFQFGLAMIASITLMVIVIVKTGGPAEMAERIVAACSQIDHSQVASKVADADQILSFLPDFNLGSATLYTFLFYILIQWWGGSPGEGFLAQRLFSTKNERHAVLAMLWFTVAHFVLRSWPWIVVGVASVIYFPNLVDPELTYPKMFMMFLPVGMKGIMIASLLAAFMSTISTHLNWGASYLTTDIYKRFIKKNGTERHYVVSSQIFVLLMAVLAGLVAWMLGSIWDGWLVYMELGAGAVMVTLLRWYWWRINAWSEISALTTSLVMVQLLRIAPKIPGLANLGFLLQTEFYPVRFLIIMTVSTLVWVSVTFLTSPEPEEKLAAFYKRVRPGGFWGYIAESYPNVERLSITSKTFFSWGLGITTVFSSLFSIGWFLFGQYGSGGIALCVTVVSGALLLNNLNKTDFGVEVSTKSKTT